TASSCKTGKTESTSPARFTPAIGRCARRYYPTLRPRPELSSGVAVCHDQETRSELTSRAGSPDRNASVVPRVLRSHDHEENRMPIDIQITSSVLARVS